FEPLVLERIFGRPHERTDRRAGRQREVVESDGVVLRHRASPSSLLRSCYGVRGEKGRGREGRGALIQLRLGSKLPSLRILLPSTGEEALRSALCSFSHLWEKDTQTWVREAGPSRSWMRAPRPPPASLPRASPAATASRAPAPPRRRPCRPRRSRR